MSPDSLETDLYVAAPDWWSRLFALGSLAVAATALYFTYMLHQGVDNLRTTPTDDTMLTELRNQTSTGIQELTKQGQSERDLISEATKDSLADLRRTASDLQAVLSTIPNRRSNQFEEPIREPSRIASDEPTRASPEAPTDAKPNGELELTPAADRPRLDIVYSAFLVDDLGRRPSLTVRNRSGTEARITEIHFRPDRVLENVPLEVARTTPPELDDTHLAVRFKADENRSDTQTDHGTYVHKLDRPFLIPSNEEVEIYLAIIESRHRGYGLDGTLTLVHDDRDELKFTDISLPFVLSPEEIRQLEPAGGGKSAPTTQL